MILASGGDLASIGISHGNSTIRICGIYIPKSAALIPKNGPEKFVLETVVFYGLGDGDPMEDLTYEDIYELLNFIGPGWTGRIIHSLRVGWRNMFELP